MNTQCETLGHCLEDRAEISEVLEHDEGDHVQHTHRAMNVKLTVQLLGIDHFLIDNIICLLMKSRLQQVRQSLLVVYYPKFVHVPSVPIRLNETSQTHTHPWMGLVIKALCLYYLYC